MARPCALLPLLALWARSPAVLAWDKDGHEAIGMTAMSALEQHTVQQVKRLMHGKDAADVAAWAHKVNKKYPWTTELHFQVQPNDRCESKETLKKPADLTHCPDNRCLVKALKHFYGRLVNKQIVDLKWPEGIHLKDADAVKFLINLMGDLHQPFHFGLESDDMGRNFTVSFRGKKSSLYDMWDREITQTIMSDSPSFWWGGWTHVGRTRVEYEKDGAQWRKEGIVLLERWADETSRYLCESIYRNPLTGNKIAEEAKDGVFHLDESLYELWKREMLSRMLVAGARTAIVLNSILQQRESENLQGGSDIKGVEPEEEEEKPRVPVKGRKADTAHKGQHGVSSALTNLGIFSVVLIVFLQVMRIWLGKDAVTVADRAKRSSEGGKKI